MLHFFLYTAIYLCFIGFIGVFLSKKDLILTLMCIDVIILAINMLLFCFSIHIDNIMGLVFTFYILTIAAAETAIGLALIVIYYKALKII